MGCCQRTIEKNKQEEWAVFCVISKEWSRKNCAGRYNELVRLVYANPSAFYLGGGLPACHRYSNQVASVFAHQLHGVRLERFCPWQRMFFLYLHPLVPDGTEKDRVEIYRLLCGDRGYTAALYLPPPSHRNYFVDLHIVYPGDDTRGTLCLNLYRYNESQRIDCGYVLAKNTSEHYHYIRYGATLFPYFQ